MLNRRNACLKRKKRYGAIESITLFDIYGVWYSPKSITNHPEHAHKF